MTQEDKELLLKDLLGRVLYGVKVDYHGNIFTLGYNLYLNNGDVAFENYPMLYSLESIESVKPYLRPMSSMSRGEKKEMMRNFSPTGIELLSLPVIDWLNEHHFDYRDLIGRGSCFGGTKRYV